MGHLVAVEPLLRVDLVGAQHGPHLVIEDLGGGTGQASEPCIAQASEIHVKGFTESARSFGDLERGEAVHVNVRRRFLHGPADVDVVVAVEIGVDAPLERHLGGPEVPRLPHTLGDILKREQIGLAAEIERHRPLGEAAELALERADVRVVDVPVVNPRDRVSDHLATQLVRELRDCHHLRPASTEQGREFLDTGLLSGAHSGEHLGNNTLQRRGRVHQQRRRRVHQQRRGVVRSGIPGSGARADEHDVRPITRLDRSRDALGEVGARIVPSQRLGVGSVKHGKAHRAVEPAEWLGSELRVDREARCERVTAGLGGLA
ncbi:unannotated protein [freshwater metagenome]|uniref:Unannotated protein n=1 Tax=freshwater metagenome TaxID=449393 RepID=A0A6J7ETQ1_9ZZZZ